MSQLAYTPREFFPKRKEGKDATGARKKKVYKLKERKKERKGIKKCEKKKERKKERIENEKIQK